MKVLEITFLVSTGGRETDIEVGEAEGMRGRRNPVWQVHTTFSVVGERYHCVRTLQRRLEALTRVSSRPTWSLVAMSSSK